MDTVCINWVSINSIGWEKRDSDEAPFYVIVKNNELLFIGSTFNSSAHIEIRKSIEQLKLDYLELTIWLGFVDYNCSTRAKLDKDFVYDCRNLLIYENRPLLNKRYKRTYRGRKNLEMQSKGCPFLKEFSTDAGQAIHLMK
ncbi:MAG: hypothetical protein MI810_14505 [Flavobacteriales bacterium]|jgi:hypothetical protein|nr:hypothetical protein [Flavobacteriales bacterium]